MIYISKDIDLDFICKDLNIKHTDLIIEQVPDDPDLYYINHKETNEIIAYFHEDNLNLFLDIYKQSPIYKDLIK